MLNRVAVVIPAHNEERLLPYCLTALDKAWATIAPMPVEVIVVADDCHDASAAGPSGLWVATTDADSRVPPNWLVTQIFHAAQGADVVVGTVVATASRAISTRGRTR